jgi:BMFP domain-containing protein YqiC
MTGLQYEGSTEEQREILLRTALAHIGLKRVTIDEITNIVKAFATFATALTELDIEGVIAEVETQVHIVIDPDPTVVDPSTFKSWLTTERVNSIDWTRSKAYSSLLESKALSRAVIDRIDQRAKAILELSGDPLQPGAWARRGLVIGDVQSGKTANYLALFNKAADAGYKIIVLFGGHTDKLRRQTQERVDEGFVGRDSKQLLKYKPGASFVDAKTGVGFYKGFSPATSLTTWGSDFSSKQLIGTNLNATTVIGPVVFVIKKNKKIIENLIAWLHSQGSGTSTNQLDFPMLLLDDEADYASINTKDPDQDPTAINAAIRDLMKVFSKNTYVAFTATPFANVFIDPDQEEDLFPKDYIYSLESPSNYFGPTEMFVESEIGSTFLSSNDDAQDWMPYSHKPSHRVGELPESLKNAVAAFFIANAIRDCRGSEKSPRTMMINVSRFNQVQTQVHEAVSNLVSEWRHSINQNTGDSLLKRLETVYQEEFSHQSVPWDQVRMRLASAISHIQVHLVNSKSGTTDNWDAVYSSDRARVIAVGGDVLSRGLTLEGLCVTYFRRRSVAYDTLMQMGRWFGYRDGYADICKLWIDPEVSGWYDFIAQATEELKEQISRMRAHNLTPKQFGLAVRRHPGAALMATALNKRRHSEIAHQISMRNKSFESVRFDSSKSVNDQNYQAAADLVTQLEALQPYKKSLQDNPWWTSVPSSLVLSFVQKFKTAPSDLVFADGLIEGHIASTRAPWMATWDVVVMTGDGTNKAFEGTSIDGTRVSRSIYERDNILYAGGQKLRLGGKGDEGQVLSREVVEEIKHDRMGKKPSEPSDLHYRSRLVRPLLIIYPIDLSTKASGAGAEKQREKGFKRFEPNDPTFKLLGIHVAFPIGDGSYDADQESELVEWYVNKPWIEQNGLITEISEEDED